MKVNSSALDGKFLKRQLRGEFSDLLVNENTGKQGSQIRVQQTEITNA